MMKGMDAKGTAKSAAHEADAVVKEFDAVQGKVTLAHGPVKSLGWPAMTMAFGVKDKALYDKLAVGAKVHVGFKKERSEEHTSELQSPCNLVCRLLLETKK